MTTRFRMTENQKQLLFSLGLIALLHLLFCAVSAKGLLDVNHYNSYTRQALAWLSGRLDLGENVSHLELAIYQGKYFVSFPPFPSYIMLPFALVFGLSTPDNLIAFFVTLVGAGYAVRLAQALGLNRVFCVFLPVFLYCGTNLWQITVDGWVWFLAQNLSIALTLMSFYYSYRQKKGLSLFLLCCAVGCRPFQLVYLPLVLYWLIRGSGPFWARLRRFFCEGFYRFLPAAALAASFLLLNFLRFGNPLEFGHNYLPEFTSVAEGQFNLDYVSQNLPNLFRLPVYLQESGQWDIPMFNGINIFLVFPILPLFLLYYGLELYGFFKTGKAGEASALGAAVVLMATVHIFVLLLHRTMGGAHFGNRYIADTMPAFFFALCLCCRGREKQGYFPAAALFLPGLLINFMGVLYFYQSM